MWRSPVTDVTKGVVNGGTFHGGGGNPAFNFYDDDNKFVGDKKYLVMEEEHNNNPKLWELKGNFIQVGNGAGDFVNVKMKAVDGGKGHFFKEGCAQNTVLAMKHSIPQ